MAEPRISVVITSYNQKDYLVEAIESVIDQTLAPYEIIIADDHSSDGSIEVIQNYVVKHGGWIRAILQPRNLGCDGNRNQALRQVSGDLVALLDGDDRFLSRKLELELATYLDHPDAPIVHSNMYFIDAGGRRTAVWADETDPPPTGRVFSSMFGRLYPGGMPFLHPLVEVRSLREIGFYDEALTPYADWDLLVRLTKRFETAYCPIPLYEYRRHIGGISRAPAAVHMRAVRMLYDKNRHLLEDVPESERLVVERRVHRRLGTLAQQAAREAMELSNRNLALKCWVEGVRYSPARPEPVVLARILLPGWAYRALRAAHRTWWSS